MVNPGLTLDARRSIIEALADGTKPQHVAEQLGNDWRTVQNIRLEIIEAGAKALLGATTLEAPDILQRRRLEDQIAALKRENKALTKSAIAAEDIRSTVFQLVDPPPEPVSFPHISPASTKAQTVVVFLSDLHWGEVINLEQMDGVNSFNLDIARTRLGRIFSAISDLMSVHWPTTEPPPERLILILGGDMVSGEIHEELAKTNEAMAMPALKDLCGHLAGGIDALLDEIDCPIDVISIPGNHGRSTRKPESKLYAATSYDTLVADFLEMHYRNNGRITFYVPSSGDALFSIYGWQMFATHGDRIGSRGGQGFVGPAATVARGFKRVVQEHSARGIHIDHILCGHFHVPLRLEEGFVNGCLSGPGEYGRDARFKPHAASQLFLAVHPTRGVTIERRLQCGVASEGSIYAGRTVPEHTRPRYRVKAVTP